MKDFITDQYPIYVQQSCQKEHRSDVTIDILSESSVLYTRRPFQTADRRRADSRMGEEEACPDLKLEEMIQEVREDVDVTISKTV